MVPDADDDNMLLVPTQAVGDCHDSLSCAGATSDSRTTACLFLPLDHAHPNFHLNLCSTMSVFSIWVCSYFLLCCMLFQYFSSVEA